MWPLPFVEEGGADATALCGRASRFQAPGIFTRLHAQRCHGCCDVLGADGTWPLPFVEEGGTDATALCGRASRFQAPGIFTRLHAQRCHGCCDVLGIPYGFGTPRNEATK